MRIPPLTALRAFEAAARLGSLSAAGRELNVTHAAIAQQIKRLEEWTGKPLLLRSGRGVSTNEDGAILASGLTAGFAHIQRAVDDISDNDAARPLVVSMPPNFASNWLIPRLSTFRDTHPQIELMLDASTEIKDLKAGEADVAVRYGNGAWPGLDARPLFCAKLVLAAATSLLDGREVSQPSDLADLPWIHATGTDELIVWLREHGFQPEQKLRSTHLPGHYAVEAIRRGQGIGIASRTWLEEDIKSGLVTALFEEDDPRGLGYYVVTRHGVQSAAVQAFTKWLLEAF